MGLTLKRSGMKVRRPSRDVARAAARDARDRLAGLVMGAAGLVVLAVWIAAEAMRHV